MLRAEGCRQLGGGNLWISDLAVSSLLLLTGLAVLVSVPGILALYCIVLPIPSFLHLLSTETQQTGVWQGYTINILRPDINHFYWHKQYNTAIYRTARLHQLSFT